jgi:hypothetical protein
MVVVTVQGAPHSIHLASYYISGMMANHVHSQLRYDHIKSPCRPVAHEYIGSQSCSESSFKRADIQADSLKIAGIS